MVVYVALSCATPGAKIRYTTDGSAPSAVHGVSYDDVPFPLFASASVRARADRAGFQPSKMARADYVVEPRAQPPAFSPSGGEFVGSVRVTVAVPGTVGADVLIRWTTDPDLSFGAGDSADGYDGPTAVPGDVLTLAHPSQAAPTGGGEASGGGGGAEVMLRAMAVKPGYAPSEVAAATFVLLAQAAPPTFLPEYDTPQLPGAYLALASATPGATIYYTTDGQVCSGWKGLKRGRGGGRGRGG
jgi:hypothetical protein